MMHAFKSYLMEQATGFLGRKYAQPRNPSTQISGFLRMPILRHSPMMTEQIHGSA
jgi:hypothetical protein